MYKKRVFIEGAYYHVTSRTNDKIRILENRLGRKIMLITLQDAKDKFRFRLANFCVMPTHIHLLIKPIEGTNLSLIMHYIKNRSAKWWNCVHGSTDHVWGHRFFAKAVTDPQGFDYIMNYIDQNPVKVGLSLTPEEWQASGAFYKAQNIPGLVDFSPADHLSYIKLLSPIPPIVSRLLPPAQLSHTMQYFGAYVEAIDRLYKTVSAMPRIGDAETVKEPPVYLHYFTETADYFICEYDGHDTLYGKVRTYVYPAETNYQNFNLSNLKSNPYNKIGFFVAATKIVWCTVAPNDTIGSVDYDISVNLTTKDITRRTRRNIIQLRVLRAPRASVRGIRKSTPDDSGTFALPHFPFPW